MKTIKNPLKKWLLIQVMRYWRFVQKTWDIVPRKNRKNKDRIVQLNYLICRCMDIDFYSNEAVFQTVFDGVKNTGQIENLEDFQKKYLTAINSCAKQINEFLEEEYIKELQ